MTEKHWLAVWARAGWFCGVLGLVLLLGCQSGQPTPSNRDKEETGGKPTAAPGNGDKEDKGDKPTAAERRRSILNLMQIALGLLDCADTHRGKMPSAAYLDDAVRQNYPPLTTEQLAKGKGQLKGQRLPLLSWRVAILPFIDERKLYEAFKLDEPWDSEHNQKLIAKMPKVYAPVRGKTREPGMTYYQVFVGPGAPFDGTEVRKYPAFFTDGASNTFLVVEAAEAVPWTKPQDVLFDRKKPLPKLGGMFPDGFHVAMADGSVRFVPRDADEKAIRAAITANDNDLADLPGKQVK
jgi:hypothetical protein